MCGGDPAFPEPTVPFLKESHVLGIVWAVVRLFEADVLVQSREKEMGSALGSKFRPKSLVLPTPGLAASPLCHA